MNFRKLFAMAGPLACYATSAPFYMSPQPPIYQIIRGQYEDKIRRYSPPEKIFNVFAITNENNQYLLTLDGLLKAICFYNYSESTSQHITGFQPKHLIQFLGKEKDFEIYDYFNLVRFLAFSKNKVIEFMKEKQINAIDKESFKQMMLTQVCHDYDTFIKQSIGLESRQFTPNKESFLKVVIREADSMFQHKTAYSFQQYLDFKWNLMKELYKFQFRNFNHSEQNIDGVEFARSIIKYAENNQKRKFLRRVNIIQKGIEHFKITQEAYVDFHFQLQTNIDRMKNALNQNGILSREEIKKLMVCHSQKNLQNQIEVLFRLLDIDNSGFIEKQEMLGVIESLGYYWNVKSGESGLKSIFELRWNSLKTKLRKIQEIIMEE